MHDLDLKDKQILSILDMDARLPLTALAKRVRLSRDAVDYRIQRLEKRGVIDGYYTVLDVNKLGLMYCRIFFKYKNVTPQIEKKIIDFCTNTDYVTWLIVAEGKYNLSVMIICDSLQVLEETYDRIYSQFSNYLKDPYVSLAFRMYHYKHNYIYGVREDTECVMDQGKPVKTDALDLKLLQLISFDARIPLIELSKKIGLTPKAVALRIHRLKKEKVILAFRAKLNPRLLGFECYKIFLTLHNFSGTNKERLMETLKMNPNVIYVTKPLGTHNLEFEIMVHNMSELHEILNQLKSELADVIVDYELNLFYSEPLINYFPERLADGKIGKEKTAKQTD